MNSRAESYINQAIASTGFVILSPAVAFKLRRDLWASQQDAAFAFGGERGHLVKRGLKLFNFVSADGLLKGTGAAYNLDRLSDRIYQLYGLRLSLWQVAEEPALDAVVVPTSRANAERVQQLRDLAALELPTHDCALQREILAAREEVARLDEAKGGSNAR